MRMKKLYFFVIILLALSKTSLTMEARDFLSKYCEAIECEQMVLDTTLLNKLLKISVKLGLPKYTEMLLRKEANPNSFYKFSDGYYEHRAADVKYLNLVNCSLLNLSNDKNNQNYLIRHHQTYKLNDLRIYYTCENHKRSLKQSANPLSH